MSKEKEIVAVFYDKCLTVNSETSLPIELGKLLADDFKSLNAKETKDKASLSAQIGGFWKMMPDMQWEIQEMIQKERKFLIKVIGFVVL